MDFSGPEYTTSSPKWNPASELPDLTGKVALVTGANSPGGIGFHIAYQLALKNAKVYVGARSSAKADNAIEEMLKRSSNIKKDRLRPFVADVGDLAGVKQAAEKFLADENRLDILVNNAAVLAMPLTKNSAGISVSFTTNHLGPFLLTTELLPILNKTAQLSPGVRIVNVGAASYTLVPERVRLNSIDDFNQDMGGTDDFQSNFMRYSLSKLATMLFTLELQRRFDSDNVSALALAAHPGLVTTDGVQNISGSFKFDPSMKSKLLSPEEGALSPLFGAARKEVWDEKTRFSGKLLVPFGAAVAPNAVASNESLAKDLWKASEDVIATALSN